MSRTALECGSPTSQTPTPNLAASELQLLADEWLQQCEWQGLSQTTLDVRRVFLKNFFWFLNQRDFHACGVRELRQFIHYLGTGHNEPGGRWGNSRFTKPLRPVSIKDYHTCLCVFFKWLVKEEVLLVSPMEKVECPKVREELKLPLSEEQAQVLVNAARQTQNAKRDVVIMLLLVDSGVRASELIRIQVRDMDRVNRQFEVTGKGNKKRTCYLGDAASEALNRYLRQSKLPPEAPLFPACRGGEFSRTALTRSGLLQIIKRVAKIAGFPANVHQMRRTFASSILEAGADVVSVRDMLGHTKIQMTLKYLAVSQSHLASQHRKFSPADKIMAKK